MTAVTELERKLSGPDAPEIRQRLLQQLLQMEQRVRAQLECGVPSCRFELLNACAQACMVAREVVRQYHHDV